ncbi:MAG: hypothetical protein COA78_03325 [Blastopirellula sp.]|nr:MAG: hypothetical protein COA78_03325 [Blastopirellula sp.]
MNLQSIIKQLKREVKKSPLKASVLGGLFLVACWFWAPLLLNWVMPEDSSTELVVKEPEDSETIETYETVLIQPVVNKIGWQTRARQIEQDPRMQSQKLHADTLDPFRDYSIAASNPATEANDEIPVAVHEISPKDVGLTLSSTIVSPQGNIARINQQNYRIGGLVFIKSHEDGNHPSSVGFEVRSIGSHSVLLERHGKVYSLELRNPKTTGSGRIVMRRN